MPWFRAKDPSLSNTFDFVYHCIRARPEKEALVVSTDWTDLSVKRMHRVTYGELGRLVSGYSLGLEALKLQRGDSVALFLPPSIEYVALALALLARGLPIVQFKGTVTDDDLPNILERSQAKAIVNSNRILKIKSWWPSLWGIHKFSVDSSGLYVTPLRNLWREPEEDIAISSVSETDRAFLLFWINSKGLTEGNAWSHRQLQARFETWNLVSPLTKNEVAMSTFPELTFFHLFNGVTSIIPSTFPFTQSPINPASILDQMQRFGVSHLTCTLSFLEELLNCIGLSGNFPDKLRRIVVVGAPVPRPFAQRCLEELSHVKVTFLYTSRDLSPIAMLHPKQLLEAEGLGCLVGKPLHANSVAICTDSKTRADEKKIISPAIPAQRGEIVICGDHLSALQVEEQPGQKLHIHDQAVKDWIFTEEMGAIDKKGRLWLAGRRQDAIIHQGKTIFPLQIEMQLMEIPGVRRAALVMAMDRFAGELFIESTQLSSQKILAVQIKDVLEQQGLAGCPIHFIKKLPLDVLLGTVDRQALRVELPNLSQERNQKLNVSKPVKRKSAFKYALSELGKMLQARKRFKGE